MSEDWIALVVVAATFGCGILGVFLQRWPPERHMSDDTRDLINRVTGLVGTMTALVLGLLTIDALAASLDSLEPTTNAQRFRLSRAADIAASMADQRLQMTLQIANSISWPFLIILVSWTSLLFFGFGITVRRNGTAVATLVVGAFAIASAVFLIVELSQPYSGLLRLPPTALVQAIDALGD
jgi:hypothetical protein